MIAVGDSHNDISMLEQADNGILFNSPDAVKATYPQFPTADSFAELKTKILAFS
ncbi:hypothetical protein imdm_1130 [gamma proteobacterium IMCC2047]|nr:hypothetical protein imdm_1130 [gamma proteobacterium IMCC2047]